MNIHLICRFNLKEGARGEGGEKTSVTSFCIRAQLTVRLDDIISASGWFSKQIAAQASLTNAATQLISVDPRSLNVPDTTQNTLLYTISEVLLSISFTIKTRMTLSADLHQDRVILM